MKQSYKILYTPSAVSDLEEIADYISNVLFAPSAAKNLLNAIEQNIARLANFPLSGTLLNVSPTELHLIYRWVKVENYMVFYTVEETAQTVTVMRILYGASDYVSIL